MLPTDPQTPLAPGAPTEAPVSPLLVIPMDPEQAKKWKGDIEASKKRRAVFEPSWERNLANYAPDPSNAEWGSDVNPGIDFYVTEQKKDQLFFDTPTVILDPEPDTDASVLPQITAQQTALNKKLGRKGLDAKRLMDKVLVDIICPSGMGCTKLGVTRITKDTPVTYPAGHPQAGQPRVDKQGQPVTAPVPVYQKIFWERFSPKKILIPNNFHDSEYDKAPWLGAQFTMPTRVGRREFQLPADFESKSTKADEQVFKLPGQQTGDDTDEQMTGVEVFYKAALYDDNVWHPDLLRQLVFVDGIDDPVVHRDCPYQTLDPNTGELTPDSMVGNPIHIFTIRDLPDSAYVPSDCTIQRPLVMEIGRFRTQAVEHRDASTSIRLCDPAVINNDVLGKVVRGPYGSIIPVPNLDPNRPPIVQVTQPVMSRENFTAQDKMQEDLTKVNSLGANQVGVESDTQRTATEMTYVQQNANVRLTAERNRVLSGFLSGVAKLDALMKRYESKGQQPISGYSYDLKPDSGMHIDAASKRKFAMDRYNYFAKAQNVNQQYLLEETAMLTDLDPSKLFVPPSPQKAEPPKTSVIVKGEDLSPLSPQYVNMVEILNEIGMPVTKQGITPELVQNAALSKPVAPPHPGSAPRADKVNQHTADEKGQPQNFGGKAVAHVGVQ